MNNHNTYAYTPSSIGEMRFRIPLYQRPYAWGTFQVEQLLSDLHQQFIIDRSQKYYIGILNIGKTHYNNGLFDLIDGQQRITTLNLIGMVLSNYDANWNVFLTSRLDLYGRKEDQQFLKSKGDSPDANPRMIEAKKVIEEFVDKKVVYKSEFAQYVYQKAAFFISKVPDSYTLLDKNLQFVRMNNRGKQLEASDVLKIKLASKITSDLKKRNDFIIKWNRISQLGCNGGSVAEIKQEFSLKDLLEPNELVNESLKDIARETPKEAEIFYQSIVSFPEFLLIALSRFFQKEKTGIIVSQTKDNNEDKRKDKLLEEFGFGIKKIDFTWDEETTLKFGELLNSQFELFDYYVIKRDKEEKYKLKDKEKFEGESLLELQVFQSYLYVSREPYQYRWLSEAFDYLDIKKSEAKLNVLAYLENLKEIDNKQYQTVDSLNFEYHNIERYWFWRLDYYLWEGRKSQALFVGDLLKVAEKYHFRVNRSIEHVEPQTKHEDNNRRISTSFLDTFGNLAMISSGLNSSLKNKSYDEKMGHVLSFINDGKNVSIESLKLLKIYELGNWNNELLMGHSDKMIMVLVKSFSYQLDKYQLVVKNLLSLIYDKQSPEYIDIQNLIKDC